MQSLRISPNGQITLIYSDKFKGLMDNGDTNIKRASHVEPIGDKWYADLSPVNGPILGPYELRQEALDAELQWLEFNIIKKEIYGK